MSLSSACLTAFPSDDVEDCRHETDSAFRAERGICEATLAMRHAGIRRVAIAWECQGPEGAPVIVAQGGISAHRHVASSEHFSEPGWWEAQCGEGKALDTRTCRVLCIDWLGADGNLDCCIDPADQADAIAAVLDALRVRRIEAFVGASYGAMVGLQFAARHGARLNRLIAISGAHRSHPQVTALRVIQRRIIALGKREGAIREALALARSLAVIGYRSDAEFAQRFSDAPCVDHESARFTVEDYFDAIGPRFVARFSPTAYVRLSESIDLQSVNPAAITVPVELIAVAQDQIVPQADLLELCETLAGHARLHCIDSDYGHDAFLKEEIAIAAILASALNGASTLGGAA